MTQFLTEYAEIAETVQNDGDLFGYVDIPSRDNLLKSVAAKYISPKFAEESTSTVATEQGQGEAQSIAVNAQEIEVRQQFKRGDSVSFKDQGANRVAEVQRVGANELAVLRTDGQRQRIALNEVQKTEARPDGAAQQKKVLKGAAVIDLTKSAKPAASAFNEKIGRVTIAASSKPLSDSVAKIASETGVQKQSVLAGAARVLERGTLVAAKNEKFRVSAPISIGVHTYLMDANVYRKNGNLFLNDVVLGYRRGGEIGSVAPEFAAGKAESGKTETSKESRSGQDRSKQDTDRDKQRKAGASKAGTAAPARKTAHQNILRQAKEKIAGLVARVRANKAHREQVDLFPVSAQEVAEAKRHNLDIEGFVHMIDSSAVNHINNNHAQNSPEVARGQVPITEADYRQIDLVISNPDKTIYGMLNTRGDDLIAYLKKLPDGSILYLEEQRVGKKKLAALSMRKYPATVHADSIINPLHHIRPKRLRKDGIIVVDKPQPRNFASQQPKQSFSLKDNKQSKQRHNPESVKAGIAEAMGAGWLESMQRGGLLDVISSRRARQIAGRVEKGWLPLAFYNTKTRKTYIVADNISTDHDLKGLMLHEIGIHAMQAGRTDKQWQTLLQRAKAMRRMGNEKMQAAFAKAEQRGTEPHLLAEEALGYFVEDNPDLSFSQRVIAALRELIRALASKFKGADRIRFVRWANALTDADIVLMASRATKQAAVIEDHGIAYIIGDLTPATKPSATTLPTLGGDTVSRDGATSTSNDKTKSRQEQDGNFKHSLIGRRGAARLDSAEEKTHRLDNLQMAGEMEAADKDAKTIRLATGWERGADGKWRYEIGDIELADNPRIEEAKRHATLESKQFNHFTYEINPDETYNVRLYDTKGKIAKNSIRYSNIAPNELADFVGERLAEDIKNLKGDKQPLTMDLDDGVSYIIDDYLIPLESIPVKEKAFLPLADVIHAPEIFTAYPQFKDINVFFSKGLGAFLEITENNDIAIGISHYANAENIKSSLNHEIQHAIQFIEGFAQGGSSDNPIVKKYAQDKGITPFEAYFRLSGEVEARNTQRRLGMSANERRNTLLRDTENVAREDQIFLYADSDMQFGLPMDFESRMERAKAMGFDTDTLYTHNSPEKEIERILPEGVSGRLNSFHGLFALRGSEGAYHEHAHQYLIKGEPATDEDLAAYYEENPEITKKIFEPYAYFEATDEGIEAAIESFIYSENISDESGDIYKSLKSSDYPSAFVDSQNFRARLAAQAGFNAVEVFDEFNGQTVMLLPGNGVRNINAAFDPEQGQKDNLKFSIGKKAAQAKELEQIEVHPRQEADNFTSARKAAKRFIGKDLTNLATGFVARVSRNSLDKMLSRSAVSKSETAQSHSLAVANLDNLFERAVLGWSKPDRANDPNLRAIHRFFAPILHNDKMQLVKLTVKEVADKATPDSLYSVETVELNEKSPAVMWVTASLENESNKLTLTRPSEDVLMLAQAVEDYNREKTGVNEPNPLYTLEAINTESPSSVLSRVNPNNIGIHPQTGFSENVQQNIDEVKQALDKKRFKQSQTTAEQEAHRQSVQAAVEKAVGKKNASHINVVNLNDILRPDNAKDLLSEGGEVEGFYNPQTQQITIIADNVDSATASLVAWHELGHRGIDVTGFGQFKSLLENADKNPTMRELADKIMASRGKEDEASTNRLVALEEAAVELYAAMKSGDWAAIERKYDINIPQALRPASGFVARLMSRIKTILAKVLGADTVSDAAVFGLLNKVDLAVRQEFAGESGAERSDIRFSRKTDAFDAAGKVIDSARKFGEALSGKGGQKSARQVFDDLSAEQQDFLGKIGADRKGMGDDFTWRSDRPHGGVQTLCLKEFKISSQEWMIKIIIYEYAWCSR